MPATDPLSLVYNAFWEMLEAYDGFADLVKVGNRIKFAGDVRDADKRREGDKPMVGILAGGGVPQLEATSSSTFLTLTYTVLLITGDQRLDAELYPLTWAIFRAISTWRTKLCALLWNEKIFVTDAWPTGYTEDLLAGAEMHGIKGWTARWSYQVRTHFTTADLLPT